MRSVFCLVCVDCRARCSPEDLRAEQTNPEILMANVSKM